MNDARQPSHKLPSRAAALVITGVVCGIAVHDQLTTSSVDNAILGALLVLAAFWLGRGIDWLGR